VSRRRTPPPRGSRTAVVFLVLIIVALSAALWRIYPEYQRLKRSGARGWGLGARTRPAPSRDQVSSGAQAIATVYFARVVEGKLRLVPVRRELPPGLGVARESLRELTAGEVPAGCERPLPSGTRLLGVTVTDGLATVDFSQQLLSGFQGGSDNEGVVVYAIVNTLTSLPTVERVQILVEGKTVSTIGGHLDTSGPLRYDGELVAE
jgi:spore germination protein GerM